MLIESVYAAPEKMVVNRFGFGQLVPNPLEMTNPQVSQTLPPLPNLCMHPAVSWE